jgi:hypothetical protein
MNPLLAKVTGTIQEDDVVPVPGGAMPRRFYRDRAQRDRVERQTEESEDSDLRRVLGEAETGVIPDNAEELDDTGSSVLPKRLRAIKDVVQEPSYPHTDKEKLLTPYAALTAPDATPDALAPIDPSRVPGKSTQSFTAAELDKPAAEAEEAIPATAEEVESPGVDKATRTMDVLLGRTRAPKAAASRAQAEQASTITSESAAYAALGIQSPAAAEAIGAAMVPGTPMPSHKDGDSKVICETFRRFMG